MSLRSLGRTPKEDPVGLTVLPLKSLRTIVLFLKDTEVYLRSRSAVTVYTRNFLHTTEGSVLYVLGWNVLRPPGQDYGVCRGEWVPLSRNYFLLVFRPSSPGPTREPRERDAINRAEGGTRQAGSSHDPCVVLLNLQRQERFKSKI